MKIKQAFLILLTVILSFSNLAMARRSGQYDEEAREEERQAAKEQPKTKTSRTPSPKRFASGIKQATIDSAAGLLSDTAESTRDEAPVVGTLEGARRGTQKVLDNTIKGAVKVATLGYGEVQSYEVEEPKKDSEDTTKIKIKF